MKKLDWSKWSAIAEVISGAAVVITLVLLFIGIRENSELTRASMYDRNIDSMNQWRAMIISDPEVADTWQTYMDNRAVEVEGVDQTRLRHLVLFLFGVYEKAYYATQYGVVGPAEWSRFEVAICANWTAARAQAFPMDESMTAEFLEFVRATRGE